VTRGDRTFILALSLWVKVFRYKAEWDVYCVFKFRLMSLLLQPFSLAASNIMALTNMLNTTDTGLPEACRTASDFGIALTTSEEFLRQKLAASSHSAV
jgi:hypothetical protein